ncbi:MAG TPA: hypothetical protein VM451_05190 [Candidatus Limnocylindria bacterium]|nr:hypothetical protein [Candidatus Limnocylindria bacterium]
MGKVRRLVSAAAVVAAIALIAVQVAAAAPAAAKAGTSYFTTKNADVASSWTNVATMKVPPGKYHITASLLIENFHYGADPGSADDISGTAINRIDCSLTAYGETTGYALTSLSAGGFASVSLDGVVDASRATAASGVEIYVNCRTNDASAVSPSIGATVVADAVTAIVDLRAQ